MIEDMAVLHISEAELARDVHSVLEKVRNGAEVVIEQGDRPIAIIKAPQQPGRLISESIAIAKGHEKERGYAVALEADFAADVEEIVRSRQPWNPPSWD
jgi:antitoxin (DNA-binding transcriptional repressor) of toxin-antitoxin stability system